jgi:hypothetical protein
LKVTVIRTDEHQQRLSFGFRDSKLGSEYLVEVRSRRVGKDDGFAKHVNVGGKINALMAAQRARARKVTQQELALWAAIHVKYRGIPADPTDTFVSDDAAE